MLRIACLLLATLLVTLLASAATTEAMVINGTVVIEGRVLNVTPGESLVIRGTLELRRSKLVLEPGSQLIVEEGGKLILKGSTLAALGSSSNWVRVNARGLVETSYYGEAISRIDAKYAIVRFDRLKLHDTLVRINDSTVAGLNVDPDSSTSIMILTRVKASNITIGSETVYVSTFNSVVGSIRYPRGVSASPWIEPQFRVIRVIDTRVGVFNAASVKGDVAVYINESEVGRARFGPLHGTRVVIDDSEIGVFTINSVECGDSALAHTLLAVNGSRIGMLSINGTIAVASSDIYLNNSVIDAVIIYGFRGSGCSLAPMALQGSGLIISDSVIGLITIYAFDWDVVDSLGFCNPNGYDGIAVHSSTIIVQYSKIGGLWVAGDGVGLCYSRLTIERSEICCYGVSIAYARDSLIRLDLNAIRSPKPGYYAIDVIDAEVDARNNWWGSPEGPGAWAVRSIPPGKVMVEPWLRIDISSEIGPRNPLLRLREPQVNATIARFVERLASLPIHLIRIVIAVSWRKPVVDHVVTSATVTVTRTVSTTVTRTVTRLVEATVTRTATVNTTRVITLHVTKTRLHTATITTTSTLYKTSTVYTTVTLNQTLASFWPLPDGTGSTVVVAALLTLVSIASFYAGRRSARGESEEREPLEGPTFKMPE